MPKSLSTLQASITSVFIFIVGQVVAYVPSFGTEQAHAISIGTTVIAAIFALVHAGLEIAGVAGDAKAGKVKLSFEDIKDDAKALIEDEISKIKTINPADVEKIAQNLFEGKIPSLKQIEDTVENKLKQLLSGGVSLNVALPVAPVAPPVPVEQPVAPVVAPPVDPAAPVQA